MGATLKDVMLARQAELQGALDAAKAKRSALVDNAITDKRGMSEDEKGSFDGLATELTELRSNLDMVTARLAEIDADEAREVEASKVVRHTAPVGGAAVTDPPVYARGKVETSYFRDLFNASRRGDSNAMDRLRRSAAQEKRAPASSLTTAAGDGGEFAPPLWLVAEYVALARQARVTANLYNQNVLPGGVSSVNVPKVLTGTSTAVQNPQSTDLSLTDMTTGAVSSGITTVGGRQIVSLQLLEQSGIPFDRVVLGDLAASHAVTLNTQAIYGSGAAGQLRGLKLAAGIQTVALTATTVAALYGALGDAISRVHAARFMPATAIVMHPRRWAFISSRLDTAGRPLVVPSAVAFNPVSTSETDVAQGLVGSIMGVPVYVDAGIVTNLGGATNEDEIFVFHREDIELWESPIRAEAFEATYADSAAVLFRLLNFSALIPDRYGSAVIRVGGAGLVPPVF